MTTVFIAGSINIKRLAAEFVDRIKSVISAELDIVVGDADGADTSIQNVLHEATAKKVTVYCSGPRPRNNVGHWTVCSISSKAEPGSRAFFTAKDVEMARVADFGLMIWDTKSTGTLSNVIELLKRHHRSVVFVNRDKVFLNVNDADNLRQLVNLMSDSARSKAEEKIALSAKISAIANEQFSLGL